MTCVLLVLFSGHAFAAGPARETDPSTPASSTATLPLRFFQQYLSGADGDRCPMFPSCSQYAVDAVRKHGAVIGWIMACDRLMRCGRDEADDSAFTRRGGRLYVHDPVENNDFWWD